MNRTLPVPSLLIAFSIVSSGCGRVNDSNGSASDAAAPVDSIGTSDGSGDVIVEDGPPPGYRPDGCPERQPAPLTKCTLADAVRICKYDYVCRPTTPPVDTYMPVYKCDKAGEKGLIWMGQTSELCPRDGGVSDGG